MSCLTGQENWDAETESRFWIGTGMFGLDLSLNWCEGLFGDSMTERDGGGSFRWSSIIMEL